MKITALVGVIALIIFNLTTLAAESTTAAKTSHHIKHHRTQLQVGPKDPYAALEPYRSFGFIGPYPGDYALRKSLRECAVDLGYGRWASCNSDRN